MSSSVSRTTARRSPLRLALVLFVLAAAVAAALGAWYLFGRGPAPSTVGLTAVPTASPAPSAPAAADPATPGASGTAPATLDGSWSVDTAIGSFDDFSGSFVGYRVLEELVGIGAATAVGRTPDVSGSLVLEGTTITAVEITADLTTLRSDSSMRDGQLGRQGLETDTHPTASFVLAEPIRLEALPDEGAPFTVSAVGDLTLHGQTRRVEVRLEALLSGGIVTVVGSLPIAFGDFGMTAPESMRVLSIDENGTMEFQLHLTKD